MKRILPALCSLMIVLSMVCISAPSASAVEIIDYNDYITNISVDGDNDIVTFDIPLTFVTFDLFADGQIYGTDSGVTGFSAMLYGEFSYSLYIWSRCYISLDSIPDGTEFAISVTCDNTFTGGYNSPVVYGRMHYYSSNAQSSVNLGTNPMDGTYTYNLTPDKTYGNEVMFGLMFDGLSILNEEGSELYTWYLNSISCTMSISSLYRLQEATGKTNEILSAVEQQLEAQGKTLEDILDTQEQTNEKLDDIQGSIDDTNDKLDDLITGGDAADDLIAGGDKLEDAGEGLGENIGQVQEFEDQYMAQLDDQLPAILESADITFLFVPLSFVQRYADMVVAGIPSGFLVVFTLPALLGLLFYMLGHPIRSPRPDTSGDTVTRETFTTTTVLEGRHAGSTTTTRTVTTSHEIGRTHASDN